MYLSVDCSEDLDFLDLPDTKHQDTKREFARQALGLIIIYPKHSVGYAILQWKKEKEKNKETLPSTKTKSSEEAQSSDVMKLNSIFFFNLEYLVFPSLNPQDLFIYQGCNISAYFCK
ncbi:hypothetical protein A0J61_04400 [Choanephora cucurbitarum]|uniref:Uncharacterized protein n=1 Tax=Choanephora cucurbitarum TaxID=101091 RepID=A0A1C7NEK7_9FUNG|nr:hypothetical protein A0J61_04400 [Choanephora cucurbitarum]